MKPSTELALLAITLLGVVLPALPAEPQALPWEREIPLKEAAQSVSIENTLAPKDPLPDWNSWPQGTTMTIDNLKMRTTLWGPPDRITVSLTKNNVWDRRIVPRCVEAPTLQEIIGAAYSPANKGFEGKHPVSQRPRGYGYLLKEGGFYDPYRQPIEYPMPCLKPVGQIILGMDPLAGAAAPQAVQSCANGVVTLEPTKGDAKASLQYVLGMTSNLYAIRGEFSGIDSPLWLRLYRHRDTAHLKYMSDDGKTYTRPGTEADKAFNFPMDPPTSGKDGRYFWIRQQMPAEKTFPQGFEYVLMGLIITPGNVELETVEGQTGLGTPHNEPRISAAPGAAATATFMPGVDGKLEALVTIVTTMDGSDVLALAKKRLAAAEAAGFDGVVRENTRWWNAFYDKRENGRIFKGVAGTQCTDDILSIYRSYADRHGGGTKTDMRQYECSCGYVLPERDSHPWSSAPCYNEPFTTEWFVRNRADNQDMWKQLVWHYLPGAKDNARTMFGMPGMCFVHGYQPPIKPDKFYHTTITLEFCFDTMAQTIKPVWDEWDYGGDIEVLRKECYPLMREMSLFYAAYAKKGDDGYYHIIPSMEPERWGWYAEFARNKDVISSLCMFRWALNRTAEASEILGVDADLRGQWREVADNLVPYPTWDTPDGPVFCAIQGVEPKQAEGDHSLEAAHYPTVLADEINLDSPKELKDMMLRTVRVLPNAGTARMALTLLGVVSEQRRHYGAEALLNSRSGRMHLFPAVAPDADLAFHDFQARGGFLVSAARNAKGVYFLEVQPRRDNVCQIMNPWPGRPVTVREVGKTEPVAVQVDKSNGECLVFSAVAGKKYSIEANGASRKTAFEDPDKIDVLVVTGGLGIDRDQFFDLFDDCHDIKCVEYPLKDESEVFEDISDWKYDVLLLYNATQDISQKRRDNFVSLLKDKGIGLVVVHHAQAAFQGWHEFHKIIGTAFIYYDVKIDGKPWPHSQCKGGMDIPVTICDKEHPITRGLTDFRVLDETYKGRWWADDNHVLLTTDHPGNDKPIAWTRSYGRSRVFNIQLGHDYKAYEVPQYGEMIIRSIRWTARGTAAPSIELQRTPNSIDVNIDGNPFTSYIYNIDPAKPLPAEGVLLTKPVLHPLRTPSGIKVTRGWPFEKIEGESQDHPHHMGLYFTYDQPDGNNFWNNSTQPLPAIRHVKTEITNDAQGNPALASVMHWIDRDNDTRLAERRLTSFIPGRDQNIIDIDIELEALAETVEFGDTKEGMFAIRLAKWLTENSGTGAYLSSNGDEKEQGIWGKRAEWVRIQGKHDGTTVGIAILNHPASTNYPTYWHVRGYGVFSANPLGQYSFEKSRNAKNPQAFNLTLRKGETARFKFRVILYDGPRTKLQIDKEYQKYAH